MTLAGISADGKDSQMIAMILLQNAKLDENTSNAIIIQLVAKADSRKVSNASGANACIKVPMSMITNLKGCIKDISSALIEKMGEATDSEAPVFTTAFGLNMSEKVKEALDAIDSVGVSDALTEDT